MMDQPIHLVFVDGLAIRQEDVGGSPDIFFSQLFPHALIDRFSFLDASSSGWRLHQRADALLEQLQKTRGESKPSPIVFLAHGFGGFVVKQALISAVQEPRYRGLTLHVSAVLFFGVPHKATANLTWEYLHLRLLSSLPPVSRHPLRFAAQLVKELKYVSESFRIVPCKINVTNFYEARDNQLIDTKCSIMGKQNVGCDGRHEELWRFAKGKANTDSAVEQILATRNTHYSLLREFIRKLSMLDSQTHQLRPTFATADTLDYAFGHATLADWENNPTMSILCISGSSGSGATSLASWVLGGLLESHEMQDITTLSFVINRSNPRAQGLFGLCLSLCRQLVSFQPQLFSRVSAAAFWTNHEFLTTEYLWIILRSMVMSLTEQGGSVYCLVCGIDQCVPSSADAVQRMEELVEFGNGRFKLLYTQTMNDTHPSVPALGSETKQRCCIALDSASQEIELLKEQHIRSRTQDLVQVNTVWDGLADSVLMQAKKYLSGSTYLLIKVNMILLQWITKSCTRKQLKEKLEKLPRSLSDCYYEVIRTIKNDCRPWVLLGLRWIAYAARPIRPTELAVAVALSEISEPTQQQRDGERNYVSEIQDMIRSDILGDLHECMAPLIKVENNRVSFIHSTFRDYLLTTKLCFSSSKLGDTEYREKDEDYRILYECLQYLEHVGKLALASISNSHSQYFFRIDHGFGLLAYATLYWPEHFLKTNSQKAARGFVLQFLEDDERVSTWAALYQHLNPSLCKSSGSVNNPLRIICKFGLYPLVEDGIRLVEDLAKLEEDVEEDEISKCFDLAVEYGHHDVVQTLLGMGIRSKGALGLAAARGFADIVESILTIDPHGINRTDQSRYAPIHHAICAGHKDLVSLFLERGTDPNIRTIKDERNLVPSDSESDSASDSDAGSNLGDSQGTLTDTIMDSVWSETSLQLAALTGQVEVIELLLSNGADLHALSSTGYDALKYAAVGGFVDAVTILLYKGAERDKPSSTDGNTALHLAAMHGHVKVVEQLMQDARIEGHPVNMTNMKGLTPVHLAAREGHLDVLNSIFSDMDNVQNSGGASAITTDKEGKQSPQDHPPGSPTKPKRFSHRLGPTRGVHRRPTRELSPLRKGCATSTRRGLWIPTNKNGCKSALELAVEKGHSRVVQALLGRTTEKSLREATIGDHGKTALHIAAKGGHSRTIELILENPICSRLFLVDNPKLNNQMTPLHLAAKAGHAEAVKVLLRYDDHLDSQDKNGWTALHHAARYGYLNCVGELLEHKSDTNMRTEAGETALHMAAKYGHFSVIRRLVARNQETLWIKDKKSTTALDLIVSRGILKEVEQFIQILEDDHGKDFEQQGTPLHTAVTNHRIEVLRFLLKRGWKCNRRESDGFTPLHAAVESRFLEGVKCLLQDTNDCDVNAVDQYGNLPLHYARQVDIVQTLLRNGAKNDEKNEEGETPLFLAAWGGTIDIIEELLNSKPKPDIGTTDTRQWSLLHAAYDSPHITELLLKHDANPDVQSQDGRTPLSLALARGFPETAKTLIEFGADPNKSKGFTSSPLCCVFQSSSENLVEMVKSLVEKGADVLRKGRNGVTALHLAVRENERKVVDYIVDTINNKEPKEKINDLYSTALCEAVSVPDFNPEMAGFLLSQGLDVNKATSLGFNPLHSACANGTVDAVKWLLNENVDINARGSRYGTALCAAIEDTTSMDDKVLLLLEYKEKPEIDLSNEHDATPLQRAALKGKASVVKLLVQHKANVNITRSGSDTPLNEAIAHWSIPLEIIKLLLESGADIHKIGVKGMLPIHIAANHDRTSVMELLCSNGADPYAKDNNGVTPLIYGLLNNSVDVVKFLLSQDVHDLNPNVDTANRTPLIVATILRDRLNMDQLLNSGFGTVECLNAQDIYGKTALIYAAQMGHLEMVQMLIKRDADPCIADCRGYGPLYWAVRMSSQEITEAIINAMSTVQGDTTEPWNIAVHGALASGKRQALERLLDRYDVDAEHSTGDGWTPLYTASRYKSDRMEDTLRGKLGIGRGEDLPSLNRPSCWHPEDKHPGINIDPKNSSVLTTDGTDRYLNLIEINRDQNCGLARTDFPMLPLFNNSVYYFEVTLNACGKGFMAVGFCDDQASLNRMLGWDPGAWGFHSDDGNVYEDGQVFWTGAKYDRPYREAEITIGCGVNFGTDTAFYTRNGAVIGRAFTEIRGKLYPAVSLNFCEGGWRVTAVFPGDDGTSDNFVFKGDLESEATFVPPRPMDEVSNHPSENSEGDESDVWSAS